MDKVANLERQVKYLMSAVEGLKADFDFIKKELCKKTAKPKLFGSSSQKKHRSLKN